MEPTPDAYVAELVAVFREVRRVLRDDGTLWLNLGDSYATGTTARRNPTSTVGPDVPASWAGRSQPIRCGTPEGIKTKDLLGMPWRVAFALQADGWYLRQDIIWSKPNPMPEGITDRCTKAHEYIFLLSKSARYFYDQDAIREPFVYSGDVRVNTAYAAATGKEPTREYRHLLDTAGRNKRSVWEVASHPFAEAHFATFPPNLIEPCIKAGCPKGGTVLDPFGGAGTTGMVADRLGRNAILIELNPEYAAMTERRIRNDAGMFAEVST
jgi:DNA modification methylase